MGSYTRISAFSVFRTEAFYTPVSNASGFDDGSPDAAHALAIHKNTQKRKLQSKEANSIELTSN